MKHIHGGGQDLGADATNFQDERQQQQQQKQQQQPSQPLPQRGRPPARSKLSPELHIPKNRSTGNLPSVAESDTNAFHDRKAEFRFSLDAGALGVESDRSKSRSASIMGERDHGLGLSGLRRIRQNPNPRSPVMASTSPPSRSPSTSLPRSASMNMLLPHGSLSAGPYSPNFAEDLSRFPSESLHSFSFAHQSEDLIHNRQNVLKRSIEFMKDRMGWSVSSNAGIASAQARATGDVETQNMLDLLARANLIGAGNLPAVNSTVVAPPLSGPAHISGENVFDQQFVPRTSSPESYATPLVSPTTSRSPKMPLFDINSEDEEQSVSRQVDARSGQSESESSSRTPTNESGSTTKTSPPATRPCSLRRTYTDVAAASVQQKLIDTLAQPVAVSQASAYPEPWLSPTLQARSPSSLPMKTGTIGSAVHGHSSRWVPAAQAIFTTESRPPYTIIAANDLACLVFGVTKAEVRKMGILEVVQEERRAWLEKKLLQVDTQGIKRTVVNDAPSPPASSASSVGSSLLGGRVGITAQLLSKPNSRSQPPKIPTRRAVTVHSSDPSEPKTRGSNSHARSRGVLLCGDVVPIQKRNGATGSASLWVKEKKVGLIWVLEEIHEDVIFLTLDEEAIVTKITGDTFPIWGQENLFPGMDVGKLIARIPRQGIDPRYGAVDYAQIAKRKYFTCCGAGGVNIPATVTQTRGKQELRVSCFPHMAGIIVVSTDTLRIRSSNSAFCGSLFGYEKPEGLSINDLILDFNKILQLLQKQEGVQIRDGIVVPEHSFRKAAALVGFHEGRGDATSNLLNPDALSARHRDGTELKVDVQMRVVKSEKQSRGDSGSSDEEASADEAIAEGPESEMVYALWVTYSRYLHSSRPSPSTDLPLSARPQTPPRQPSPGQAPIPAPPAITLDSEDSRATLQPSRSSLSQQIKDVALSAAKILAGVGEETEKKASASSAEDAPPPKKKSINDFVILEDMGQGAYGQVKLARSKYNGGKKVVLKYVTKKRILVDTWTRDRRLGTVPLEIHVLDYLRRDGLKHPNIVEMEDFFEDDVNYYIEMTPHGIPGMDLFDYIELRANMEDFW
ncbi:Pkinase-domain-containing protein [Xylariaceae sp. FL0594]|nr:Pkinase-domain-containing protein [Xylariaceae sp. FL0594]